MASALNISPEILHRIASLACGGLDTLPHNGAVITTLAICGLTHKQSYKDIFITSVVIPIAVTAIILDIFLDSLLQRARPITHKNNLLI